MSRDDIRQQLISLTECSICTEKYNDPSILPCVHTYCLKCIKGFSEGKVPGSHVLCPICWKDFIISDSGIESLPKNFLIEQLKDETDTSSRYCDGCFDDATEQATRKQPDMYCMECHQKFCESCVKVHRRTRMTQGHKLVEIGDDESVPMALTEMKLFCDKHLTRAIDLYCLHCNKAICFICFVELHQSHNCCDMSKVVDEFRQKMKDDIKNMSDAINECLVIVKDEKKKNYFSNVVEEIKKEIHERAEQFKKLIDLEEMKLLKELESRERDRVKQIQQAVEKVQQHASLLESLVEYTEELRNKGTSSAIAQQARILHDRADKLMKIDDVRREISDLGSVRVSFEAVEVPTEKTRCLIGEMSWQQDTGNSTSSILSSV